MLHGSAMDVISGSPAVILFLHTVVDQGVWVYLSASMLNEIFVLRFVAGMWDTHAVLILILWITTLGL